MTVSKKQISKTNQLITDLDTAVQKAEELKSELAQNISDSKKYFEDIKEYQTKIKDIEVEVNQAKTDVNNGLKNYNDSIQNIEKLESSAEQLNSQLKGDDDGNHNGEPSLITNAEDLNDKTKKTLEAAEKALGVSTDASLFSEYINKERLYKNSGRFILFLQVILLTAIAGSAFWFFPFQNEVNINAFFNFSMRAISISPLVYLSIILLRVYNVQKILAEEYAHKATLAKTIAGYRKQFNLSHDNEEYAKLFEDFQNAITANPSDRIATILNRKEPQVKGDLIAK